MYKNNIYDKNTRNDLVLIGIGIPSFEELHIY